MNNDGWTDKRRWTDARKREREKSFMTKDALVLPFPFFLFLSLVNANCISPYAVSTGKDVASGNLHLFVHLLCVLAFAS